mgnify:CR=1 FL=1
MMLLQERMLSNFRSCIARNEQVKVDLKFEHVAEEHYTLDVAVGDYSLTTLQSLISLGKLYGKCYLTHELITPENILRFHFNIND